MSTAEKLGRLACGLHLQLKGHCDRRQVFGNLEVQLPCCCMSVAFLYHTGNNLRTADGRTMCDVWGLLPSLIMEMICIYAQAGQQGIQFYFML